MGVVEAHTSTTRKLVARPKQASARELIATLSRPTLPWPSLSALHALSIPSIEAWVPLRWTQERVSGMGMDHRAAFSEVAFYRCVLRGHTRRSHSKTARLRALHAYHRRGWIWCPTFIHTVAPSHRRPATFIAGARHCDASRWSRSVSRYPWRATRKASERRCLRAAVFGNTYRSARDLHALHRERLSSHRVLLQREMLAFPRTIPCAGSYGPSM